MSIGSFIGDLAGYYRDIEVAKATKDGTAVKDARVESIPDQTSVGQVSPTGPGASSGSGSNFSIGGLQLNKSALVTTGVVLAGLAALKWVKS